MTLTNGQTNNIIEPHFILSTISKSAVPDYNGLGRCVIMPTWFSCDRIDDVCV